MRGVVLWFAGGGRGAERHSPPRHGTARDGPTRSQRRAAASWNRTGPAAPAASSSVRDTGGEGRRGTGRGDTWEGWQRDRRGRWGQERHVGAVNGGAGERPGEQAEFGGQGGQRGGRKDTWGGHAEGGNRDTWGANERRGGSRDMRGEGGGGGKRDTWVCRDTWRELLRPGGC